MLAFFSKVAVVRAVKNLRWKHHRNKSRKACLPTRPEHWFLGHATGGIWHGLGLALVLFFSLHLCSYSGGWKALIRHGLPLLYVEEGVLTWKKARPCKWWWVASAWQWQIICDDKATRLLPLFFWTSCCFQELVLAGSCIFSSTKYLSRYPILGTPVEIQMRCFLNIGSKEASVLRCNSLWWPTIRDYATLWCVYIQFSIEGQFCCLFCIKRPVCSRKIWIIKQVALHLQVLGMLIQEQDDD